MHRSVHRLLIIANDSSFSVQNFTREKAVKALTPYLAAATMDFVKALWKNVENADEIASGQEQDAQIRLDSRLDYSLD